MIAIAAVICMSMGCERESSGDGVGTVAQETPSVPTLTATLVPPPTPTPTPNLQDQLVQQFLSTRPTPAARATAVARAKAARATATALTPTPTFIPVPTPTPKPASTPTPYPPNGDGGPPSGPCGPISHLQVLDRIDHFIDWTPDGPRLIFDHGTLVMMVNNDGSGLRAVVDANPGSPHFPGGFHADLSPDGSRLAYTSCQYKTEDRTYNYEIASVAIDGSDRRRLTEDRYMDHYPHGLPMEEA